jgi:hypothetical protein
MKYRNISFFRILNIIIIKIELHEIQKYNKYRNIINIEIQKYYQKYNIHK